MTDHMTPAGAADIDPVTQCEMAREPQRKVLDTDTKYKAVSYIETYTGRKFFPLAPSVEMCSIIDIAHHLSNQCRYSGATEQFYSTAQHCCILASYVENVMKGSAMDCLQILIHDAAEAYLVDVPRPVKQFMPDFRIWDRKIQMTIREWLGLADVAIPTWQDDLDSRVIVDERHQIMSDSGNDWGHDLEPLKVRVEHWPPRMAEKQFLFRYAAYMSGVYGKPAYLDEKWGIYGPRLKGSHDGGDAVDLLEVDLLGGVGRVKLRSDDGMLVRDTKAGQFPRPAWKWVHGKFDLLIPAVEPEQV